MNYITKSDSHLAPFRVKVTVTLEALQTRIFAHAIYLINKGADKTRQVLIVILEIICFLTSHPYLLKSANNDSMDLMKPSAQNISHGRKSTRLKGYDYSSAGAYFITLITYQRDLLFGKIENGKMKLSPHGEIVQEEWFKSVNIRKEIRLYPEEFVVMPNHIHGIVWIVEDVTPMGSHPVGAHGIRPEKDDVVHVRATGRSPLHGPKPKSLSSFVAGFKSSVTKRIRDELNETGIWQRNYHDHIIRNEHELDAIRKYIETNPLNWELDEENPIVGKNN